MVGQIRKFAPASRVPLSRGIQSEILIYMPRQATCSPSDLFSGNRAQIPAFAHRSRIGEVVGKLASRPHATLYGVARAARGIFPAEIVALLREAGATLPCGDSEATAAYPGAELHAAEFEWYFSQSSRETLASFLLGPRTLLLGAPSLAATTNACKVGVELVDRSPFLSSRFPDLNLRWRRHDLRRPLGLLRSHRTVFFDAPWHEDHIKRWLWQASLAARPGGTIAFALFPELTRAAAQVERDRLLNAAERLGRVELMEGFLEYDTPRFEHAALSQAGASLKGPWRLGDLAIIHNVHGSIPPPPAPSEEAWVTILRGREVVKIRQAVYTRPDPRLPLRTLESVSRSETLRGQFDLITSRQAGACLPTLARR